MPSYQGGEVCPGLNVVLRFTVVDFLWSGWAVHKLVKGFIMVKVCVLVDFFVGEKCPVGEKQCAF